MMTESKIRNGVNTWAMMIVAIAISGFLTVMGFLLQADRENFMERNKEQDLKILEVGTIAESNRSVIYQNSNRLTAIEVKLTEVGKRQDEMLQGQERMNGKIDQLILHNSKMEPK